MNTLPLSIPEAIRLLEKKEYEAFLKRFMTPDDLKKITEEQSLAEFAAGFGERKAPRLLKVLETIKDQEPKMESDGKKAVYELTEPEGRKGSISFAKIDNLWYLQN